MYSKKDRKINNKAKLDTNNINKISLIFNLVFNILIIMSSIQIIFSEDINSYDYLKLKINQEIEFKTIIESNYNVESFELSNYFFPQTINSSQYLNEFNTSNQNYNIFENNITNNLYIKYNYNKNTLKDLNKISNEFIIEKIYYEPKIYQKINYPIKDNKNKQSNYLEFKDLIDITDDIKTQSSKLAEGEDDVFIIAAKIAKWIREDVNYDLNSVLENPNQKSSEVFISKSGVCKEITNLYVSMLRSLNIESRVVSGYAYTDSEELVDFIGSHWGGHAWAEVLIGDVWVPFDLTYNQYGYIDPTHIILARSDNNFESQVGISAKGYGFNLVQNSLKTTTDFQIIEKSNQIINKNQNFNIQIEGPDKMGFESYGYIKIKAENLKNYYQILFLNLIKTNEVELLDTSKKMLILPPKSKDEIVFRYKIPSLNSGYTYTFPFEIQNEFINEVFNVEVKEDLPSIKKIVLPEVKIEDKKYSNEDLEYDCNFIIESPNNKILCSIKNYNNYEINNINICLEEENKTTINNNCKKIDLKINEMESVIFETKNFKSNIILTYQNKTKNIELEIEKPILSYKIEGENEFISLTPLIENHVNGILTNIYVNDKLEEILNVDTKKFYLNLKKGQNIIKFEVVYANKILTEKEIIYFVEKTQEEQFYENLNLFEKMIFNISSFFYNLFI